MRSRSKLLSLQSAIVLSKTVCNLLRDEVISPVAVSTGSVTKPGICLYTSLLSMATPIVPTLVSLVIIVSVEKSLSGLEEEIVEFSSDLG